MRSVLLEVADVIANLRATLHQRPHYILTEAPAPDPVTRERLLFVEDWDAGTLVGKVQLGAKWISGTPISTGHLQVRLTDPFGARKGHTWRRKPTPITEIAVMVDEWLIGMRATATHRRALEAEEAALNARLAAISTRLGRTSLAVTRTGPAQLACEVILRPLGFAEATQVLALLSEAERLRARPAIWIRVGPLTPERLEALVAAADPLLKVPRDTPYRRRKKR